MIIRTPFQDSVGRPRGWREFGFRCMLGWRCGPGRLHGGTLTFYSPLDMALAITWAISAGSFWARCQPTCPPLQRLGVNTAHVYDPFPWTRHRRGTGSRSQTECKSLYHESVGKRLHLPNRTKLRRGSGLDVETASVPMSGRLCHALSKCANHGLQNTRLHTHRDLPYFVVCGQRVGAATSCVKTHLRTSIYHTSREDLVGQDQFTHNRRNHVSKAQSLARDPPGPAYDESISHNCPS